MLEAGIPFSVVGDIMGWSPSTAIRMTKRYGHIGHTARRQAVEMLGSATAFDAEGAQKWAQWQGPALEQAPQALEKNGSSGRTRTYNPPVNSGNFGANAYNVSRLDTTKTATIALCDLLISAGFGCSSRTESGQTQAVVHSVEAVFANPHIRSATHVIQDKIIPRNPICLN